MKKQIIHLCGWLVVGVASALPSGSHAQSPIFTTLHNFDPVPWGYPSGLVQGSDGSFYGTTEQDCPYNAGTVFKMTSSGSLSTLYAFSGGNDGGYPYLGVTGPYGTSVPPAGLVQGSDGDFYGTTNGGGAAGQGTVFKITSSGSLTTLYSFSAESLSGTNGDGASPLAGWSRAATAIFMELPLPEEAAAMARYSKSPPAARSPRFIRLLAATTVEPLWPE